jgi:hypothetical protein
MGAAGSFGSGFAKIPVTGIVLVIAVIAVGTVAWRKGYVGKIRARLHR